MKPSKKNERNIALIITFFAFLMVVIFAPRMDGPREILGVKFTTKGGQPGLTDLDWLLLVTVPPATFFLTLLVMRQIRKRKK